MFCNNEKFKISQSNLKSSQETPVYRGDLRFSTMFDGNANDTVDYQFYKMDWKALPISNCQ